MTVSSPGKPAPHPLDSAGRVLPEPSWPDAPGSAGRLEVVRRFLNTINRQGGADAWRSPHELDAWLASEGHDVVTTRRPSTRRELVTLVALRDALWTSIRTGSLTPLGSALATTVGDPRARFALDANGNLDLVGGHRRTDEVVVRVLAAVRDARLDGTWQRLKACAHCQWIFYDGSKNCSGRWCSMRACGGREKARAYRRRRGLSGPH